MKHAAKRVRGTQAACVPRARRPAPLVLLSAATATGTLFCAPPFSAFAQTRAPNPAPSSVPLQRGTPTNPAAASVKTTFPIADGAPLSFASDLSANSDAPYRRILPLSRIKQDGLGNATETQLVNLITSAALAPDGNLPTPDQPLWLGTQYGVKRVQNQTVRYYTPDDGLPGAYVEAVANDAKTRAAWCLVRTGPVLTQSSSNAFNQSAEQVGKAGRLAFCQWDSQTDTWRSLAEIVVPGPLSSLTRYGGSNNSNEQDWLATRALLRWEGKAKIAQSGRYVAFASSVAARNADALVYLWDKKTQKLRPLGWETGLQNNTLPFVGVSFVHIDEARQTLWVGTSQGLYARSLSEKGKWRTYLAGRTVGAGAVSGRDKNALYLTCKLPGVAEETYVPNRRMPTAASPTPGQRPAPIAPDWQLLRVTLSNGEVSELPGPPSMTGPERGGFSYDSPRPTTPTGLYVDADKSVWITLSDKASPYEEFFSVGNGGNSDARPSRLERFDLTAKTWERISLSSLSQFYLHNGFGAGWLPVKYASENGSAQFLPEQQARIKELDTIPSGALMSLALTYQSMAPSQTYSGLIPFQTWAFPPSTLPTEFWIMHRFPHWYGASDPAAQAALGPVYRNVADDIKPSGEVDTAPDSRVWTLTEDRLATVPRADLIDTGRGGFGYRTARIETIPLEATFTGLQTPLLRIVPSSAQTPSLLIGQGRNTLFLIDTATNLWKDVFPPDTKYGSFALQSDNTSLIAPEVGSGEKGTDRALVQLRRDRGEPVRRWNTDKRVWETEARLPVPDSGLLLGRGANGAAWYAQNNRGQSLAYQEAAAPGSPAPPAPVRIAPQTPSEWGVPGGVPLSTMATGPVAVRGSRVFYVVPVRGDFFNVPSNTGEVTGDYIGEYRSNSSDTAYVGSGRLPANFPRNSLAGYDIAAKKWTSPLPLPQYGPQYPNLLFAGEKTYVGTLAGNANGAVWQWNDTKNTWDVIAPPLPLEQGLFVNEAVPMTRSVVPLLVSDRYVWVFVAGRMIARYDRRAQKWETVSLPAALRAEGEREISSQARQAGLSEQAHVVAAGPDRFCVSSDKGGLWLLRLLPGAEKNNRLNAQWTLLAQSRTVRSRPLDPPATPTASRIVSPPRQAEFSLSNVTVTPRFVWATGSTPGNEDRIAFVARWNKAGKTWTTWGGNSSLPPQSYISSLIADGDSVWLSGQNGTYYYDESANRWDAVILPSERYGDARPKGNGSAPLNGQIARLVPDADGAYLLLHYPTPNTPGALLWRWSRADKSLRPLTFPERENRASTGGGAAAPTYLRGIALLNEPDVLWVGTNDGLWAWDKKAQTWSKPALPAFAAEVVPNQIVRSENALVLFGPPVKNAERGVLQAVRLVTPPFAKRP